MNAKGTSNNNNTQPQQISFSFSFGGAAEPSTNEPKPRAVSSVFEGGPAPAKAAIFAVAAAEETREGQHREEEDIAKMRSQMHVRTGYANVTKSSEQIGRNTSNMAVKQHKKHQVVDSYFTNKLEELEQQERAAQIEEEGLGLLLDGDHLVARVMQALSSSKEQEQQMLENYMMKC